MGPAVMGQVATEEWLDDCFFAVEEATAKMHDLEGLDDWEIRHARADALLVELVERIPWTEELLSIYNTLGKWYA